MTMPGQVKRRKTTINSLNERKAMKQKITALGVYDSPMASIADQIGFDMFIIGNSGPMSLFGYETSTSVEPDDLLFMCQAVDRATKYAMIVATLPYMSYLTSTSDAISTAAKFVSNGGADAVQCHGNRYTVSSISAMVRAGVPVLAHLGLQSVRKSEQSGYRIQGKNLDSARNVIDDALAMVDAGVFAVLLELVPQEVTAYLASRLPVPVIGLGSGPNVDGVYLVSGDAVGYSVFQKPKNAGQFANVKPMIETGIQRFDQSVRDGTYPSKDMSVHMPSEEYEKFVAMVS